MGRSLGAVTPDLKTALPISAVIESKSRGHSYRVFWERATLYQSESFLNENGTAITGPKVSLEYVVGSGMNGYTFLFRRGSFLFEAPASYYSRTGTWELSPGFDSYDAGFSRPIRTACLECHVGRFAEGPQRSTGSPIQVFAEAPIGCENCHGPGQLHLAERRNPRAPTLPDNSIVNPARLSAALSDDICFRCHQGNDARVLQPGKVIADFRPGTWLDDTVAIFKVPLKRGQETPESNLLEHGSALTLSKCYRSSKVMACTSCHSVHQQIEPAQKAAYYRSKCLVCHSTSSCRLDVAKRQPDDCISCHMPKQAVPAITHTALTNHRIVRTIDEPYPHAAYIDNAGDAPGLIHFSSLAEPNHERLPDVVLLQAYRELLLKAPWLRPRYIALLDRLRVDQPAHPIVLAAAGHELLLHGTSAEAEQAAVLLRKALKLGEFNTDVLMDLAEALAKGNRLDEASQVLKEALTRDPYDPRLHKSLINLTMKAENYAAAVRAMSVYLRLYPDDNEVKSLLQEVQNVRTDR